VVPSAAEEQEVMEARQTEVVITATSPEGFAEAIREGLARATASLRGVQGVEIRDQKMIFEGGSIVGYQVNLAVTFDLDPESVREELGVVLDPEEYRRLSEAEEELEDLRAYDDAVMELTTGEDVLTHWEDARVRIEAERAELRRRGEL
jgi:dodecin